jgi:hypothetical protein
MISTCKYAYTKTDRLAAALIAIAMLALCAGSLNCGCSWGDDSAAYISEGIAIAEGNFKEQVKLNVLLHPSILGDNVKDELVYVWGYPLLLSVVYLIDGFDTDNYSNIIAYKIPSAVFFAVMAVCFFLLLRRRFSLPASAFTTCIFCGASFFFEIVNSLYSDMVYMGMCMLTLLCIELYIAESSRRALIVKGIGLGAVIWYAAEVRTNGLVFVAVLLTAQLASMRGQKRWGKDEILPRLIPYAVFLALKIVTEYVLLRPVTPNSADISVATSDFIFANILFYITNLADFATHQFYNLFASLLTPLLSANMLERVSSALYAISEVLGWASLTMAALGILTDGIKKNLHLSLYVIFCAVGTCLLPYTQGLRYMMGIMPVMAVFSVYGYRQIFMKARELLRKGAKCSGNKTVKKHPPMNIVTGALTVILCLASCYMQYNADVENIRAIKANGDDIHAGSEGMYSPEAIEIYDYIKANTPQDAVFAFHKPRALYLNTGRLAFSYLVNDRDVMDADYCILPELFYQTYVNEETPEWFSNFEVVLRNSELTLMIKK